MGSCQFLGKSPGRKVLAPALLVVLLGTVGGAAPAAAQLLPGVDDYAAAIVTLMQPRWVGPRVPWPLERARPPESGPIAASLLRPITIHAAAGIPEANARTALEAAEAMHDLLRAGGYPLPPPDGGLGGDGGFDLYLVPRADTLHEAVSDGPWLFPSLPLDGAIVHAEAVGLLPPDRLFACVAEAYAEATLLAMDPAEGEAWRRATATYLASRLVGRLDGCHDDVVHQQEQPFRAFAEAEEPRNAGGALLLAMLSDRHDGGSDTFVRELWTMARQRTWEGTELRASPDLWEVIDRALDLSHVGFRPTMVDFAIARFFAGSPARASQAPLASLRTLPPEATVPIDFRVALAQLPEYLPVHVPSLRPLGSSYALVDVRGAPRGSRIRAWLRGEYGVRWSLVAIGLDDAGREHGRVLAPPSENISRNYLPYELAPEVTSVLLVVTNLSGRVPDADALDEHDRTFHLIVDLEEEAVWRR